MIENKYNEKLPEVESNSDFCNKEKTNKTQKFKNGQIEMEENLEEGLKMMERIKDLEKDLPEMLKKVINPFNTEEEKMIVLTATIAETGALFPKVWFNYDGKKTYPMLMMMVVAPPASGKGVLSYPMQLLSLIDKKLIENREEVMKKHLAEVERTKAINRNSATKKLPLPKLPEAPLLFIPGNITQPALIQQLSMNGPNNPIVIFEQEADAFGLMAKRGEHSFGNTGILRSLFHSEDVSQLRKTNFELLHAKTPKGVVIFSGTENQVTNIFNSNRDGLFSRFLFITFEGSSEFRNVFSRSKMNMDDYFNALAPKFFDMWEYFREREVEVDFTMKQKELILAFGQRYFSVAEEFESEYAISLPKRHANMLCRIATISRMIRYYQDKEEAPKVICYDQDVSVAMWIAEVSILNSLELFENLTEENNSHSDIETDSFFKELPSHFKTKEMEPLKKRLSISGRSYHRYIKELVQAGLLEMIKKGNYRKTSMAEMAVAE